MKKFLLILFSGIMYQSHAQQFYLPPAALHDSVLERSMPDVTRQLIEVYKKDKAKKFTNLLRFQVVAGHYSDALKTIDSLPKPFYDTIQLKGQEFQFLTYCIAKQQSQAESNSFESIYQRVLKAYAEKLPEKVKSNLELSFLKDLEQVWGRWTGLLATQRSRQADSITYDQLQSLVHAYSGYLLYGEIFAPGKHVIDEINGKDLVIQDSVQIPMRDGAIISATIVRKKNEQTPLPVVLMFNIYAGPGDLLACKKAVQYDFTGIVANTRGKKISPQEIAPFEHDAQDAYDIIDWISKQPWCNGKVGMYGGSYLGFAQWAAAKYQHPALKTIVPQVAAAAGIDYPMKGNVFESYMLRWIHYVTNNKLTDDAAFSDDTHWQQVFAKWYTSGRSFRALDTIEGHPNKIFQRWLSHPAYDAYWQKMIPNNAEFAKLNIPVLTTTGYYDGDQLGAMYYLRRHYQSNAQANHYLVIGPYDHGGAQSVAKDVLFGYAIDSVAQMSFDDLVFSWFNYTLKGGEKPALLKNKFNIQVMGANTWAHLPSLTTAANKTFYLSSTSTGPSYRMLATKPNGTEYIHYEINLADRGDTARFLRSGSAKLVDSMLNNYSDVMFASNPLQEDITLLGSFEVRLNFITNKKDVDVTASLYEQLPDGRYFYLSSTGGRASYAANRSHRQLLTPGKKYALTFPPAFFVSKLLHKGSRLVLTAGVQNGMSQQINYGSGKDVSDETIQDAGAPMQLQIFNDSFIRIPVMK